MAKCEIKSGYLNTDNTKNKEMVQIMSEGELVKGQYGEQYKFKVQTASGLELSYTPPNTVLKNIFIKVWGDEMSEWINKTFYAEHIPHIKKDGTRTTKIYPLIEEPKVEVETVQ